MNPPISNGSKANLPDREKDRSKILLFFGATAVLTAPIFVYVYYGLGSPLAGFFVAVAVPLLLSTFFIWRMFRSPVIPGNWIISVGYLLFLAISLYTGGIESPALVWSVCVPIVATLMCGWRSGLVWFILVLLKFGGLFWAGRHGHIYIQQISGKEALRWAFYINMTFAAFFSFFLAAISEFMKDRYLNSIKTLSGLLPICAWCKKIRNDSGYWDKVETYFEARTNAEFSHGVCPDCEKKLLKGI